MNKDLKDALEEAMPYIANRIQSELMINCPVNTGRLRNSIKVKAIKGGILIWMASYGQEVEFGSSPHIIKPVNKKALKFKSEKDTVFAKVVHHPGTRPNPFIRNTLQIKLKQIVTEELQKVNS